MVEIIRKHTGEVCMLADPGGVFTTHAKLICTRKELDTQRVSIVSRDTWEFLQKEYEIETLPLTKTK